MEIKFNFINISDAHSQFNNSNKILMNEKFCAC